MGVRAVFDLYIYLHLYQYINYMFGGNEHYIYYTTGPSATVLVTIAISLYHYIVVIMMSV